MEMLTLTVREAAKALGLSRNSAYAGIARGDIPSLKVGKRILVPREALERLLEGASAPRAPDGHGNTS